MRRAAKRVENPLIIKQTHNGHQVRTYKIAAGQVYAGSSRKARVRIMDPEAAGMALAIEYRGHQEGWVALDLGSQEDLRFNGSEFTEEKISKKSFVQLGKTKLEFFTTPTRRQLYREDSVASGPSEVVQVVKYKGKILDVVENGKPVLQGPKLEILTRKVPVKQKLGPDGVGIEPEFRRPLFGILSAIFILFALLLFVKGPATTEEKPPDNIYTRMIVDSKIMAQRKQQLRSFGKITPKGTGNGNGELSEGAKGQGTANKVIKNLRQAGVQSLISRIAKQANKSAMLIQSIIASPGMQATGKTELGIGAPVSVGAATGKTGLVGNGKGFAVTGIGTGGKGGGTGSYKSGTGLGTGSIGNGEVGLDESDAEVEGGLDKEVIKQVITSHLGQIRYCYERQLSASPDLYGKVTVKFSIGPAGLVVEQNIGSSSLKNAMVEECILRRIATWSFPKPKGGTKVLVSYPFLLKNVK